MVPSLPFEVEGGENNEINYKIISFSAIGGNCSVQSLPSHSPPLDSRLLRLHLCLPEHFYN